MLQEMSDSCAMKHPSADAMLHALVHEKRHRLNAPLGIQHAISMRHIVICGLPGSSIFFHIISGFSKKMLLNMKCVLIFSITFV
jgi:hypothetical protein